MYPRVSYCNIIDIWGVSQGEWIFVYVSYHLGQYHPKYHIDTKVTYLGMNVLEWYVEPNIIKKKITLEN